MPLIDRFFDRGRKFLGSRYPIMCGAMTWISDPGLVSSVCKLDENTITREEAQFEVERFWVGALRRAAVDGDVVKGSLMAGQSVGLVKEIKPLAAIIQEMIAEAEEEMLRLRRIFDQAENEKIQKRQG